MSDQPTKSTRQPRKARTFYIKPSSVETVRQLAVLTDSTQSKILEYLIERHGAPRLEAILKEKHETL